MTRPAAYLRKSNDSATKAEHLDRLMATVKKHGHNGDTVVYDDWARSGDQRKLASRKAWRSMIDAIERGDHDVVFMNDLDRGGRSLEEWLRFIRIAQDHGVRVIAGDTDYSAAENKDRLIFEAWLAERELDAAKRRAAETIRMRRKRGDAMGQPPYGFKFARGDRGEVILVEDDQKPLQPVLDAVEQAGGNTAEAVRLLNDRGVPSRYGKAWTDAAIRQVLRRNGAMVPARKRLRSNGRGQFLVPSPLSKMVKCHCGQTMTPVDSRNELYCYVGSRVGAARHGKTKTTQRRVYDFLKAQVASGFRIDYDIGTRDGSGKRDALKEKLRRLGKAYQAGAVDDEEFDDKSVRLKAAIAELEDDGEIIGGTGELIRDIEWDGDPVKLGDALRQRVRHVQLDSDLQPVAVELRSEAYRRNG